MTKAILALEDGVWFEDEGFGAEGDAFGEVVFNTGLTGYKEVEMTHINLNDKSLEGFRYKKHPIFCAQYHPENAPRPHDRDYLFTRFYELISKHIT